VTDTNGFGPQTFVDAPPASVPRVGLVASGRVLQGADANSPDGGRWENGFKFLPENCTGYGVVDPCDSSRDTHDPPDMVAFQPYEVWAGDKCSPFQFRTHDFQARAQRLLLSGQSKAIEGEFWTGTQAIASNWTNNRYLTDGTAVTVTGGANDPEDALACLEQALADCGNGARGMIHCTKTTLVHWSALHLIIHQGDLITTDNGTIVVAGSGYDGSGPTGTAASSGSVWAYATSGIVEVRLGQIYLTPDPADPDAMAQATDRSLNLVNWRASRPAAATWDGCCLFAAEINAGICPPGGS